LTPNLDSISQFGVLLINSHAFLSPVLFIRINMHLFHLVVGVRRHKCPPHCISPLLALFLHVYM